MHEAEQIIGRTLPSTASVIQTFPISKPFSFCTVNQQHNTQKVWILFVIFVVDNVSFNFKATNYDKGNK